MTSGPRPLRRPSSPLSDCSEVGAEVIELDHRVSGSQEPHDGGADDEVDGHDGEVEGAPQGLAHRDGGRQEAGLDEESCRVC